MLRQRDEGKEVIKIKGGQHVTMEQWALKKINRSLALANTPEQRQTQEVWARLDKLQAPWELK